MKNTPPHIVFQENGLGQGIPCYFNMLNEDKIPPCVIDEYISKQPKMVYWYTLESWKKRKNEKAGEDSAQAN